MGGRRTWLSAVLVVAALSSCATVYERYHFAATQSLDSDGGSDGAALTPNHESSGNLAATERERGGWFTNYYRVTINAWTLFSASQYASGLYDAEAVERLFGELEGPGKLVSVDRTALRGHPQRPETREPGDGPERTHPEVPGDSGNPGNPGDASPEVPSSNLRSMDGQSLGERKLVFFLSTNADSLVNQISALTSRRTIENSLTGLVLGPEVEERERLRMLDTPEALAAEELATRLEALAARLAPETGGLTTGVARQHLVDALRELALHSSEPDDAKQIDSLESALTWRRQHPLAFQEEETPR